MKNNRRVVHEKYHSSTRRSVKIIHEKNFTYRLLLESITPQLNKKHLEILDIGCGAGALSLYLASKGHSITGIDISKKAIKECIKSVATIGLKNTNFVVCDFPETDFKRKFDLIIFTEVIEHLADDTKALKAINTLLKPSGKLILSTPSVNAPLYKLGITKNFDEKVGHLRRYSLPQLKKLLKETGFSIIKTKKSEGILRNFLFVNPVAGKLIRYVNFFASDPVTWLDNISLKIFGESNYIIVARKEK